MAYKLQSGTKAGKPLQSKSRKIREPWDARFHVSKPLGQGDDSELIDAAYHDVDCYGGPSNGSRQVPDK